MLVCGECNTTNRCSVEEADGEWGNTDSNVDDKYPPGRPLVCNDSDNGPYVALDGADTKGEQHHEEEHWEQLWEEEDLLVIGWRRSLLLFSYYFFSIFILYIKVKEEKYSVPHLSLLISSCFSDYIFLNMHCIPFCAFPTQLKSHHHNNLNFRSRTNMCEEKQFTPYLRTETPSLVIPVGQRWTWQGLEDMKWRPGLSHFSPHLQF